MLAVYLCIALWMFASSRMYAAVNDSVGLWWGRVGVVGIALDAGAIYHYALFSSDDLEKSKALVIACWGPWGYFLSYRPGAGFLTLFYIIIVADLMRRTRAGNLWSSPPAARRSPAASRPPARGKRCTTWNSTSLEREAGSAR